MRDIKREIYLNNYWALFLDFIQDFSEITYRGIPLPLLANFYQYLDSEVKELVSKTEFALHLRSKIFSDKEIQPLFERWLKPLTRPLLPKPIKGKVLLNLDYLRLSINNYSEYFNPDHTVIFSRSPRKDYLGIPVHCIKDYREEVTDEADTLAARARDIFKSLTAHPVFYNSNFIRSFTTQIPRMVETIASINRYLEKEECSCVIIGTTEDLNSRVLAILSAVKGIPCICLQHGLLGGPEAFIPVFPTKLAVYGQSEKDWYLNKGLQEDRIAIIGHPRYDDIFTQNHMSKENFQKKFNLDPAKTTILLATQPYNLSLWNEFIQIMAENSEVQLIIKPHPWETLRRNDYTLETMNSYEFFASKYSKIRLFDAKQGISLFDVLANIDLVVCNYSTVGLETLLFRKPLFILNSVDIDYYRLLRDFTRSSPADLAVLISKYLSDQSLQIHADNIRKSFLTYAYPYNLAGPRLQKLIHNITLR